MLTANIVEHNFYFNSVSVEAFVHLGGLEKVANVGHSVRVSICETDSNAALLHSNTTKVNLAHIALCGIRCFKCEQVFAGESRVWIYCVK